MPGACCWYAASSPTSPRASASPAQASKSADHPGAAASRRQVVVDVDTPLGRGIAAVDTLPAVGVAAEQLRGPPALSVLELTRQGEVSLVE